MALKVFSRCSELSVRNSAKSSNMFPHPGVALGPLIGGTRFDYRAPMLAPGGLRGERYKGRLASPAPSQVKRICPSAGRFSQMQCKTNAGGRNLGRHGSRPGKRVPGAADPFAEKARTSPATDPSKPPTGRCRYQINRLNEAQRTRSSAG